MNHRQLSVGCVESAKTHRFCNRRIVRPRRLDAPYAPRVEPLEDRTLMSTCHVTRLTDQGVGKGFRGDLRYCINKVNTEPGPDAIDFTVTGSINLNGPLPELSTDIEIAGPGLDLLKVRRATGESYRILTVVSPGNVLISGLTLENGALDANAPYGPRGAGIFSTGTLTVRATAIQNNAIGSDLLSGQYGGGIYNAGTMTVEDSLVRDNYVDADYFARGGGIANHGQLAVVACVVSGNRVLSSEHTAEGGGIYNHAGADLTVIDSTVMSNIVEGDFYASGGGIFNYHGAASIYSSAILDNEVRYWAFPGTGIDNWGGFLLLVNSTVHGNDGEYGGAVHSTGLTIVSHSTISSNTSSSASGFPGGIVVTEGEFYMRNTIVAGNNGDIRGSLAASDHNLIGHSNGGSGYGPNDILDVDPMLGPLTDNGGPTPTMALLPGSPAIDAGDNTDAPEWDQRGLGFPRIVNGTIDIGAFEVQSSPIPPAIRPGFDLLAIVLATADLDSLT